MKCELAKSCLRVSDKGFIALADSVPGTGRQVGKLIVAISYASFALLTNSGYSFVAIV